MFHRVTPSPILTRPATRLVGRGTLGARVLAAAFLVAASIGSGSTPSAAPLPQGKPDQVFYRNARGDVRSDSGRIIENSLTQTVIEDQRGDEKKRASDIVVRVVFSRVPPAFTDGKAYGARGDFENAAAKFRLVAGDSSVREPVRARARFLAAQALMDQGKLDAEAFASARGEWETYLSDHAEDRDVPLGRMHLGRAALLSGDAAKALEVFSALFEEAGSGTPTTGYPLALCYRAGIAASEVALSQGDADTARAILGSIESGLPAVLSGLEEDDPARRTLLAVQSAARLGEGWLLLSAGQTAQAVTFFRTQVQNAQSGDSELRFGALLGLAEALLADGEARAAQIEFAKVSSLDFASPDRVARALTGLAACALKLPDAKARTQAKQWVQTVITDFGDTPAVLTARELIKGL